MAKKIKLPVELTEQQKGAGWTIDRLGQRVSPQGEVISSGVQIGTGVGGQNSVLRSRDVTPEIPKSSVKVEQEKQVQEFIAGGKVGALPLGSQEQVMPGSIPQGQEIPTIKQLQEEDRTNPFSLNTQVQQTTQEAVETLGATEEQPLGTPISTLKTAAVIAPGAFNVVFSIVDSIRALTTLGGRDTIKVQEARSIFANLKKGLELETQNVANGGDETEALNLVRDAIDANEILSQAAHAKGAQNILYRLRGGLDLEIESEYNLQVLEDLRNQLLIAIRTKQARQAGLI